MDCVYRTGGGITEEHSLDQPSTALHPPIYDRKIEGKMERKTHENLVEPG